MFSDIVKDYLRLQANVYRLIDFAESTTEHVAAQMEMDIDTFRRKQAAQTFTPEELLNFLSIIREEELEDKILAEMGYEHEDDEEDTWDEVKQSLDVC